MTALYLAFREQGPETYYLDMKALLAEGELEDEHIKFMRTTKFAQRYPDLQTEADKGIARIATLARDELFFPWTNYWPENKRSAIIRLRNETLAGFKHYSVPCVVLPFDLPLAAVAKIFETINRTGVRLDTFDLVVAKMYPHEFRLRDEWENVLAKIELIEKYGISGLEILKLIALRHYLSPRREPGSKVKGVRESDVLSLQPDTIKSDWNDAAELVGRALEFLRGECGAVQKGLVPSMTMVLPLAFALGLPGAASSHYKASLKRWFWTSAISQTYGQGANTQAVSDARALSEWLRDPETIPETVRQFSKIAPESLLDGRRRNRMLLRAVLCALTTHGALDWCTKIRLSESDATIETHHIFAKRYLESIDIDETDPVVNFTPLLGSTNKKLRNDAPSTVLARTDVSVETIATHFVSTKCLKANDWRAFQTDRANRLAKLLNGLAAK